jgi:hypothetical protein
MRDEMSKTMSGCVAAVGLIAGFVLSLGTSPANAIGAGAGLRQALVETDLVLVQDPRLQDPRQQQRRKKQARKKRSGQSIKISDEHKQKIRETVPQEYHQYLPKNIRGTGAPAR